MKIDEIIVVLNNKCIFLESQRNICLAQGDLSGYERHTAELEETKSTLAKLV